VLARPLGRTYDRDPFVGYADIVDQGSTPFPVAPEVLADKRLTPGTTVVVATINGETRAWPTSPARTVTDTVGGVEVLVSTDGVGGSVRDQAGEPIPTRTSFWFAIVASFPEATIGL
jgi:hypothetical protein